MEMHIIALYGIVNLLVGAILGGLLVYGWLRDEAQETSGAAYDACLDDELETDHDTVAIKLLESCDFL